MDRLESMAVFIRVADLGSFAAAAGDLDMSPQMVAKHVMSLEARLGVRLLNRTTRRQSLTEVGNTYLQRCRVVLAEDAAADAVAQESAAEPRGRLRISAPSTFGAQRLAPFIARFLRQFPKLEIDLVLSDGFVDLVEDGFEVAFRTGMLTDSRLMARALSPFLLVACASPAYLGERGAPIEPADLKRHECVGFAHWPPKMVDEWRFVREDTVYEVSIRSRLKVNNARALLAAAREGFGIVLIAQDLVRDELASGQLVRVMPDFEVPSRGLHMLYLADRQQTPKLRAFIDNAIHEFKL